MLLLLLVAANWTLPTLAGLLAAAIGRARCVRRDRSMLLFSALPGGLCARFFARSGMAAFTWGCVVVVSHPRWASDARLLRHERVHVLQCAVLGALAAPLYGLCSLWAWARGGDPYLDNAMERAARRGEGSGS